MIKRVIPRSTFTWFFCAILLGIVLFATKYHVTKLETQLDDLNNQILSAQESLDVLKAEWTYLNKPQNLQTLNDKYLSLVPPQGPQITTVEQLTTPIPKSDTLHSVRDNKDADE